MTDPFGRPFPNVAAPPPPSPGPPPANGTPWKLLIPFAVAGLLAAAILGGRALFDRVAPASKAAGTTPQATAGALERVVEVRDGGAFCALLTPKERGRLTPHPSYSCEENVDDYFDYLHTYEDVGPLEVESVEQQGSSATAHVRWEALEAELQLVDVDGRWRIDAGSYELTVVGGLSEDGIAWRCSEGKRVLAEAIRLFVDAQGRNPASIQDLVDADLYPYRGSLGYEVGPGGSITGTCPG